MKIVSAEAMGRIDSRAIQEYGIPGVLLMENAALQVVRRVEELFPDPCAGRIAVLCGRGNNGGDGFVITRHLRRLGYTVHTWAMGQLDEYHGDAALNYNILLRCGVPVHCAATDDPAPLLQELGSQDLVIDALLGTGLSRRLSPPFERLVRQINTSPARVLAVDIPSGLSADTGEVMGAAVRADYTVTFALPKRGLFLFPAAEYVGEVTVADIGIPAALTADDSIKENLVTGGDVRLRLPGRQLDSHKGTQGRVLILAGSPGMTGAAVLAGEAALRSGAGLVYVGTASELRPVLESKLKEVISIGFPGDGQGHLSPAAAREILLSAAGCQALVFGPGLDPGEQTRQLLQNLLAHLDVPLVVDAGGLGVLSGDTSILKESKAGLILTPHPGEMARLTGLEIEEVQRTRWELARREAAGWQSVVVLKGANSVIALPGGELYINPTGNPLLSTAGTGDVLSGLLAALSARGLDPADAALCGVYLHGLAADLLAAAEGPRGALAEDISRYLPRAWNRVLEPAWDPGYSGATGGPGLFNIRPYAHAAFY